MVCGCWLVGVGGYYLVWWFAGTVVFWMFGDVCIIVCLGKVVSWFAFLVGWCDILLLAFVSVHYFGCLLWFGGVVSGGFGYGVVFLVFLFLWLTNARLMLWLRTILGACCGFGA